MKTIINDLPKEADAIYQAIKNDPYSRGDADYSVSDLIAPARKVALERAHENEIVENASDKIFSLVGQSIHTILERANKVGVSERRLSTVINGVKVSGGMDVYHEDGVLIDYKTTSLYSIKGETKEEWSQQLNAYSYILRQNGFAVNKLVIVAILRDWSKTKAKREQDYPLKQVVQLEIPLWDDEKTKAFLEERIKAHQSAKDNLPECNEKERWAKPDIFAIHKKGRASAVKLHEAESNAKNHLALLDSSHSIEFRPGESIRCASYCGAAPFCTQWKDIKGDKNE